MKFRFDNYKDKEGDCFTFIKFLLIPRKCTDKWWRWLEWANCRKIYIYKDSWLSHKLKWHTEYYPLTSEQKFNKTFKKWLK